MNDRLMAKNILYYGCGYDGLNRCDIVRYITLNIDYVQRNNPNLYSSVPYWLFYYIQNDFLTNMYSLENYDLDSDPFGFPTIRRNTRHAIEAFIDLVNLCHDENGYLPVLRFCDKKDDLPSGCKYEAYAEKTGYFSIYGKSKIAQDFSGENFKWLCKIYNECNAYVHDNTSVELLEDRREKIEVLLTLVKANFYMLEKSFGKIMEKFGGGKWVNFGCRDCPYNMNCYACLFKEFKDSIGKLSGRTYSGKLLKKIENTNNFSSPVVY